MLEAALAENPAERLVVLVPSASGGRLQRDLAAAAAPGATIIDCRVDPWLLLDRAARVYSAGGEIGFLALVADLPVTTFRAAFYTGWGATDDALQFPARPFQRTIDEIFAGCCLIATRCRDPFHDTPASFEDVAAMLAD